MTISLDSFMQVYNQVYNDVSKTEDADATKQLQDIKQKAQAAPDNQQVLEKLLQDLKNIQDALPKLPTPKFDLDKLDLSGIAVPSMGASVLSLITELADEQRRANNEARFQQTEATVAKMHEQAEEIRDKAVTQLALGITANAISMGASLYGGISSAKAGVKVAAMPGGINANQATLQGMLQTSQGYSQAAGMLGQTLGTVASTVGGLYDADIKHMDAQIEQLRAMSQQLDNLNDSLKELIRKAIDTQNTIEQNMNQTRTKILS